VLLRFLYSVVFERKRFVIKILAVNWAKILVARLQLRIGGRASHASQFLKGARASMAQVIGGSPHV